MKIYDIFISYATVDFDRVLKIVSTLEEMGYSCWYAPRDISPGMPYARAIIKGIETCPIFMVILTENSVISDNVLNEVENAHTQRKTIIPVFLNYLTLPAEMNFYIRRLHWASLDETKSSNILSALGLPPVEEIRKNITIEIKKPEDVQTGSDENKTNKSEIKGSDYLETKTIITPPEYHPKQNINNNKTNAMNEQKPSVRFSLANFLSQVTESLSRISWKRYKKTIIIGSSGIVCILIIISIIAGIRNHSLVDDSDFNMDTTQIVSDGVIPEDLISEGSNDDWLTASNKLVDMGLSVLWASQNIGADKPTDLGNLYEWSAFMDDSDKNENVNCNTALQTNSAYNLEVRIPTADEWSELKDKCTWTWMNERIGWEKVVGYKVTGPNGNSIFLPAAGRITIHGDEETPRFAKRSCNYWTSSSREAYWGAMMYLSERERTFSKRPKTDKFSVRVVSR